MKNVDQITPDKLVQMMGDVVEAGRATDLISGGYLDMIESVMAQVPKRYARGQFKIAKGTLSAALQKTPGL